MSKKDVKVVLTISLTAPFLFTILFINEFVLLTFVIYFIAILMTIASLINYMVLENIQKKRKYISLITFGTIGIFFLSYGFQLQAANIIYYGLRQPGLNKLLYEIQSYRKIYTMTDMRGYNNQINDKIDEVYENEKRGIVMRNKEAMDINQYLDEFNIDITKFEKLRESMAILNIISFKVKDKYVFFETDGFMNITGYIYSQDGSVPLKYKGLGVFHCQRITDNWFYFNED